MRIGERAQRRVSLVGVDVSGASLRSNLPCVQSRSLFVVVVKSHFT